MLKLVESLKNIDPKSPAEDIQKEVYAIGREFEFEQSDWFGGLYQVLLGAERGPRFGSFVALYGINETIELIQDKCA